MKGTMEMTGIEFKNKVEEFLTNKDMTVAEHEKMFKELRSVALRTIRKFIHKYDRYFMKKYDVDYIIDRQDVYDVKFSDDGVTFLYWDESFHDSSSSITIPYEDFIKWIDNDVNYVQKSIINDIIETLKKQVETDQMRIKYYQKSVEHVNQLLSKIGKMKFNDIKKWYDKWLDDAI